MNLKELDTFNLGDAVKFHDELNPVIFDGDYMKPEVRTQLLLIAQDFVDHLGINHLDIEDITISGSSAAYSYTPHSDIDLHILVDMGKFKNDDVYRELFDAKKVIYNDQHDINIGGFDVELYVQDSSKPVVSLGEYSVKDDKWIRLPRKRRANFDQAATKLKYQKLYRLAEFAVKSSDSNKLQNVLRTIKKYRQAGLDLNGEFGPENLAYKALRTKGVIEALYKKLDELHSKKLSLPESKLLDKPELSVAQLAKKHKVSKGQIQAQLSKGIKVEMEHTSKYDVAKEIALDHLAEKPDYYDKLDDADLEEGWKEKLAGGALAAGMALAPGQAKALDWKDAAMFLPGVGPAVKAYNVGSNLYQAAKAGKQLYDLNKTKPTVSTVQPQQTDNTIPTDQEGWEDVDEAYRKEPEGWLHYGLGYGGKRTGHQILPLWNQFENLNNPYKPGSHNFIIFYMSFILKKDPWGLDELNGNEIANTISKQFKTDPNNELREFNLESNRQFKSWDEIFGLLRHSNREDIRSDMIRNIEECSGYIPSEKEKNDKRFKTALTVDVKPDSIKKNAKAFNFKVSRAGIPPLLR